MHNNPIANINLITNMQVTDILSWALKIPVIYLIV